MNSVLISLVLSCMFLSDEAKTTPIEDRIESLTWKNRIIVLYAPGGNDEEFLEQKRILANNKKATQERDLVVIECVGNALTYEDKGYVARHFDHDLAQFGVWLIGKDGGTKLAKNKPVPTEKFFGLIDSMPMRRAEMKRDGR